MELAYRARDVAPRRAAPGGVIGAGHCPAPPDPPHPLRRSASRRSLGQVRPLTPLTTDVPISSLCPTGRGNRLPPRRLARNRPRGTISPRGKRLMASIYKLV